MLEYKLVRLPSEASLAIWENFINSFAVQGWKFVQLEQGTVGSGPGYVILERMKSSEDRYSEAYGFPTFEKTTNDPPKSKSNPIGGRGRAAAVLDTNI